MPTQYYFISDLHIGGDGVLDECEFEPEIKAFLRKLRQGSEDTELIVAGDMFGLWETTTVEGADKLHAIIAAHWELFQEFRATGSHIRITVIPGNHDHELANDQEYASVLRTYNIHLEPTLHITREIGERTIWIEHGNQHDFYNRLEDPGNPLDRPIGYHVTQNIVSGISSRARNARDKWLKDVECVYPTEYLPHWLFSNYFYREMSTFIRVLVVPFLVLLVTSGVMCVGALLELAGAIGSGAILSSFANSLGSPGYLLDIVFLLHGVVVVFIACFSIPYIALRRDLRRVLSRYGIDLSEAVIDEKESRYLDAATRCFEEHPDVAVFVFGHTHAAAIRTVGNRAVINTGTWLKKLTCVPSRFYLLPAVYCPSYHLGYVRIQEDEGEITITHHPIVKDPPQDLSFLQHLSILGKSRDDSRPVPRRTVLRPDTGTPSAEDACTPEEE